MGRVVLVVVDPAQNNGSDVAPALVTAVFGGRYEHHDGLGERETVNVRVLCDSSETLWLTSIQLFEQRPDKDAWAASHPHWESGYCAIAFWPPRT
ncbi:MAG: hypothetical protein ACRDVE_20615 [Actinocrinis sp.]